MCLDRLTLGKEKEQEGKLNMYVRFTLQTQLSLLPAAEWVADPGDH